MLQTLAKSYVPAVELVDELHQDDSFRTLEIHA